MPPPDHRRPFPDEAHEAVAVWLEEALADLADSFLLLGTLFELHDGAAVDLGTSQADLSDSLLLVATLFDLLDQATTERDQLRADLDALTARVAALEPAPSPDPPGGLP